MRKGQQLPGIEPRTLGLCSQCSATELQQPDNHQLLLELVADVSIHKNSVTQNCLDSAFSVVGVLMLEFSF